MKAYHDVHIHNFLSSCCSDTTATVENYLKAAKDVGLKLMGFANHTWDESIPGASKFYKKQSMDYELQILSQIPEDTQGIKVLVGAETEYCGMTDTLGMGAEAAKRFDFLLIPHTHVHMRDFVMPHTPSVHQAREKLAKIFENIEGLTPERAVKLAEKVPEAELDPFMDEPKTDYVQWVADFMVDSFRSLMNNELLKTYSDEVPISIAHPFQPVGTRGETRLEILRRISDETFGELFEMAKNRGIGLEINGACGSDQLLRMNGIAKEVGCKFTLGSDTHSCENFVNILKTEPTTEILGITEYDMMDFVRI